MDNRILAELEKSSDRFTRSLQLVRRQRAVIAKSVNGTFVSRTNVVTGGIYQHLRRGEAIWNYLFFAGVPQTIGQISAAITHGKCKSKAADELRATASSVYYYVEAGRLVRVWKNSFTISLPGAAHAKKVSQKNRKSA